jgi:branched-chain amino acid aminotransferase
MELPYSISELQEATRELIRRNGHQSCYIRPLAFRGYGEMGLYAQGAPIETIIATWPWGAYLGEDGKRHGIRVKVSSWRAISGDSLIPHAKASGQYLNSILAKTEAQQSGYEEAILLDQHGRVSEGSGENVFVVRDGALFTPGHTSAILDGITRASTIQIARDLGYRVEEREIARAELYLADEAFLTGTAAELVPVREVDDHPLGEPGEITRVIQAWKVAGWVGLSGMLGSAGWFTAMTIQNAAYVRALGQIELVFTFAASYFFFHERANRIELAGIALVIGGILLLLLS